MAISVRPNSSNQSRARHFSVRHSSSRKKSFWLMSDTINKLSLFKLHSSEGINIIQFPQGNQSFWLLHNIIYICSHHSMQILHVSMQQVMSSGSLPINQTNKQIDKQTNWINILSWCLNTMLSRAALMGCPQGLNIRLGWSHSVPPFLGTEADPQKHIPNQSQPSCAAVYQRMLWPICSQELVE